VLAALQLRHPIQFGSRVLSATCTRPSIASTCRLVAVWRRYHPSPPKGKRCCTARATLSRLGRGASPFAASIDDCSDISTVHHWVDSEVVTIGALTVVPRAGVPPDRVLLRQCNHQVLRRRVVRLQRRHRLCETSIDLPRDGRRPSSVNFVADAPDRPPTAPVRYRAGAARAQPGWGSCVDPQPAVDLAEDDQRAKLNSDGPCIAGCAARHSNVGARLTADRTLCWRRGQNERRRLTKASPVVITRIHLPHPAVGGDQNSATKVLCTASAPEGVPAGVRDQAGLAHRPIPICRRPPTLSTKP